ncbi:translocation/assembly module TamB domain-containing protein [Flammeovirgaceae bacterium SG7u.111]|nr:translocation/assembly module TamB domain-containing protein [Flammeovirgaceae bacterium SG7u.132]WPO34915.1 translocation/assembly module TamB domain-containing protein [Flammeovirgaceae bacterium SG7u.111]
MKLSFTHRKLKVKELKRLRYVSRLVSSAAMFVLILFMATIMVLQYPFIQTQLAHFLTQALSEKTGHKVVIENVHINWFDLVRLEHVQIDDLEGRKMVQVDEILVDFSIKSIYNQGNIFLDKVMIKDGEFNLIKGDSSSLNFTDFVKNINELSTGEGSKRKKPEVLISTGHIDNMIFTYFHEGEEVFEEPRRFDHFHFGFDSINGYLEDFRIHYDTIEFDMHKIGGVEQRTGVEVERITTQFRYTSEDMIFNNLYAKIEENILRDSLVMHYDDQDAFSNFNNEVEMVATLDSSVVTTEFLSLFATSMQGVSDVYTLNGNFRGTVKDFRVINLDADFGKESNLKGRVVFKGLPNFTETLMNLKFYSAEVTPQDLKQYFPEKQYNVLEKFGKVDFNANFFGFYNDFVTDGQFRTGLGYVETDINLKVPTNFYVGKLKTEGFKLGQLIGQEEYIQQIDMNGQIRGTGLALENAKFDLDGAINRIGILNYDYANIRTDGHFEEELFNGELLVQDPNIKMAMNGDVNFKDESFNFVLVIDSANLLPLNLAKDSFQIHTTVDAKFNGLSWDSFSGGIALSDSRVHHKGRLLELDTLLFSTEKYELEKERDIVIVSELFDAKAKGQIDVRLIYNDFLKFMEGFTNNIQLDDISDKITVAKEKEEAKLKAKKKELKVLPEYGFSFYLDMKDVNRILYLLDDGYFIAPKSTFSGDLHFGEHTEMIYKAYSDSVFIKGYNFYHDTLAVYLAGQQPDSVDQDWEYDFEAFLSSSDQSLNGFETENFVVNASKLENRVLLESQVFHAWSDDMAAFNGNLGFYKEHFEVNLVNSNFLLLNKPWSAAGINKIDIKGNEIMFNDVKFVSGVQEFALEGTVSSDTSQTLNIDIKDFDLNNLSAYIGKKISGKADVKANIADMYSALKIESDMYVDSIVVSQFNIGNLDARTSWDDESQQLDIDAQLDWQGYDLISIGGHYAPYADKKERFGMTAYLNAAPLELAGPFLEGVVSDLDGVAIGMLDIKGSPINPFVKGTLFIEDGQVNINATNTTYRFSDKVDFSYDTLRIKKFRVQDVRGRTAYLNGSIYQNASNKFIFDLLGDFENFQVINLPESPEALYYGEAYGTGNVRFYGPPDNVSINVTAKSERNTKIYIPLEGSEDVQEQDYITFVSQDTVQVKRKKKSSDVDLSGLRMNLDLEITPDAYCEIIFDKKAGDIIRGNGKGQLSMSIDTKGEFKMYGDVSILKGAYNFTLLNVVDKRFGIEPNSHITWTGDPYGATLDITATYTQMTSLAPIMDLDSIPSQSELRRRYPVEVLLYLKGQLLSPNVDFYIDVQDYPNTVIVEGAPISLESYVADFEQRIKNDEQELNRQVFSLIVLKKLSPETTFSGMSQSAGSSVSELLANQLSYWVSQVDDNLEIDVDLNGLNAEALNTFQLRLSYNFLDGRLKVTRAGAFTNQQNETDLASVFGDVTVEYLLTPEGQLRMKMYHKSNVNAFNTGLENNNSTAGFSLLHTASFDSLIPKWFRKKKDKPKKEKKKKDKEADPAEAVSKNEDE